MDPFFSVHLNKRIKRLDHTIFIDKFFMVSFEPICIIAPIRNCDFEVSATISKISHTCEMMIDTIETRRAQRASPLFTVRSW